jgi:hypothetical protein
LTTQELPYDSVDEKQAVFSSLQIASEFGLILEDMHDENVIAKNDVLFFIDTVFYIMERK